MLIVSSDTLISSIRNIKPKKLQKYSKDEKLLIIMPEDQARRRKDRRETKEAKIEKENFDDV